jgi:hypothetical protein
MAYKPNKSEKEYFKVRTVWPLIIDERVLRKKVAERLKRKKKGG